jgi:hypothetical protein
MKITRALFFGFRHFLPLVTRLCKLGLKKQNRVELLIETEDFEESNKVLFKSSFTIRLKTENAVCVIFGGQYFPIFRDDLVLKIQYPLESGKNKLEFKVVGFLHSTKFDYTVDALPCDYKTINPPKNIVITSPKQIMRNSGEIKLKAPSIKKSSGLINQSKPPLLLTYPKHSLKKTTINLDLAELEKELKINSNLNQN